MTQPQNPYQHPAGPEFSNQRPPAHPVFGAAPSLGQVMPQPAPAPRPSQAGLVAAAAGGALILGSFLPWGTVSAPIVGQVSMSGTDGSDGWVTVFLGVLLAAYGLAVRARRLPAAVDVFAALAGLGAIGWAGWHIWELQEISDKMQASMAQTIADDEFGIAASFAAASQFKIGAGLWLLVGAGLVATLAAGAGLYKRL